MKRCSKCSIEKPLSRFSKKKTCKDGYSSVCKDCHNAYVREIWYPKNKSKQVKATTKWKKDNREKDISHRHSVPLNQVEDIFKESDGKCEICEKEVDLFIDHCHTSNEVRGLLCRKCNSALGFLGDSEEEVLRLLPNIEKYFNK